MLDDAAVQRNIEQHDKRHCKVALQYSMFSINRTSQKSVHSLSLYRAPDNGVYCGADGKPLGNKENKQDTKSENPVYSTVTSTCGYDREQFLTMKIS